MATAMIEKTPVTEIDYELVGYVESLLDSTKTIRNGGGGDPLHSHILYMTGCAG